jgi:hypothetical protein
MNYFGTVATLQGVRPLLARSAAPRAVAVTSMVRRARVPLAPSGRQQAND